MFSFSNSLDSDSYNFLTNLLLLAVMKKCGRRSKVCKHFNTCELKTLRIWWTGCRITPSEARNRISVFSFFIALNTMHFKCSAKAKWFTVLPCTCLKWQCKPQRKKPTWQILDILLSTLLKERCLGVMVMGVTSGMTELQRGWDNANLCSLHSDKKFPGNFNWGWVHNLARSELHRGFYIISWQLSCNSWP